MRGILLIFLLLSGSAFAQLGGQQYGPGPCPVGASGCIVTSTDATATKTEAAWAQQILSAGAIDITQAPYSAVCNGSSDISSTLQTAVNTGRTVYLPAHSANQACVFGNINLSGYSGIVGNNTIVRPPAGSNYLIKVTGTSGRVSGLWMQDITSNGAQSRVAGYTTLASPLSGGTWSGGVYTNTITVASVTGTTLQVGQRFEMRLDDGGYFSGRITSVAGSTIGIKASNQPLYSAATGNFFGASFGMIYVSCGAKGNQIKDIFGSSIMAGVLVDCPDASATIQENDIENISLQVGARLFNVICSANCTANFFDKIYDNGGWVDVFTATGDGVTTTYTDGERQPLAPTVAGTTYAVTVGGVTKSWPADYTITNNGQNIVFGSAPANAAAISITRTIFTPEGTIIDPAGVGSAVGNTHSNIVSGGDEISFAWRGNSGNNFLAGAVNLGPSSSRSFLSDVTIGTANYASGHIFAGGSALAAVEIVNNTSTTSVTGNLVAIPNTSAGAANGVASLAQIIDPAANYFGLIFPSTTAAPIVYNRGGVVAYLGTSGQTPVTAYGTCTVTGPVVIGNTQIPCSATTGSLVAGQVDLTDTTYFTGSNTIVDFSASTIQLSGRVLAQIANGTVLTFGPASLPSTNINLTNLGIWGTGVDGVKTITSGTTTASRDLNYTNLTITGGTLHLAGSVLHVSGTTDLSSAPAGAIVGIVTAANNASGATAGAVKGPSQGIGTQLATGANGSAGGTGNTTTGTNPGAASSAPRGIGGDGGAGGNGGAGSSGGGTGAAGGTVSVRYQFPNPTTSYLATQGSSASIQALISGQGGSGGGQGGGDTTNAGGGGGGGGPGSDCVVIFTRFLKRGPSTAASAVQAKGNAGGNGAAGVAGNAGGGAGGGGSGGGCIYIVAEQLLGSTATNALDVSGGNGGTGGAGVGTGVAGGGGVAGNGGSTQVLLLGPATFTAGTANTVPSSAPSGTTGGVAATVRSDL